MSSLFEIVASGGFGIAGGVLSGFLGIGGRVAGRANARIATVVDAGFLAVMALVLVIEADP